jgi:hypothetical protein
MKRLHCSAAHGLGRALTLPSVPYHIPHSAAFEAERSGGASSKFIEQLPKLKAAIRNSVYLSNKDALWNAPSHEAVEEIVTHMAYHDVARYVMEHNWFHLFNFMLMASDAPLPHVVYEDFMKCKTFSSLQAPPEEQFALEPTVLRSLLCYASHAILTDEHYFGSAESLFRTIEQQQRVGAEVLSAWTLCLVAGGKIRRALDAVMQMEANGMKFDPVIFALMMHPHVHPSNVGKNALQQGGKGFILQQRLQNRMSTVYGTATVAVHAMFTHYVLTMQHAQKWDVLRHAVELGVEISDRTLTLALEVFAKERGARCGPKTMRALVRALASHGSATDLVFALYSCRRNELLPEFCDLPPVEFEEEEVVFVMSRLQSRSQEDKAFALVAPLVSVLMIETDPVKLEGTIRHVLSGGNASTHFELPSAPLPSSNTSDALPSTPHTMPAVHTAPIADQYNDTTMLPSEVRSSTSDVQSNRTALMELLQTSVIPRAHRKKFKRRSKSSAKTKGPREPDTTIDVVVGSPLEGRTLTEKLTSDLYSDARALNVASMVFELEQHREEERKRHAATAWINPDY